MFLFILSLIVLFGAFIVLGFGEGEEVEICWKIRPRQLLCLFALILTVASCVKTVPTGHKMKGSRLCAQITFDEHDSVRSALASEALKRLEL